MDPIVYRITVDFAKEGVQAVLSGFIANEKKTRRIVEITAVNAGEPITFGDGDKAQIVCKYDGSDVVSYYSVDVSSDKKKLVWNIPTDDGRNPPTPIHVYPEDGTIRCAVQIGSGVVGSTFSATETGIIRIVVSPSISDDGEAMDAPVYQSVIQAITAASNATTAANTAASNATTAAGTATTAAGNATTAAQTATETADAAAGRAYEAASSANAAAGDAHDAESAALLAADAANDSVITGAVVNASGKLVITQADGTETVAGDVIGPKGDNGADGQDGATGETGNGIASVELISTVGLVKTYRITFTDETTFDFQVSDGEKGDPGGVTVDSELSTTSENPVQNKVITVALENYVDKTYYATTGRLGLVQLWSNSGIATDNSRLYLYSARNEAIFERRPFGGSGWGAITPSNIDFLPEALGLPASQVGSTAPTTATVGKVGDLYVYKPTNETTATVYVCIAADKEQTPAVYTWVLAYPYGSAVQRGILRVESNRGINFPQAGAIGIRQASEQNMIDQPAIGASGFGVITTGNMQFLPPALGLATVKEVSTPPHSGTDTDTDPGTEGAFGEMQACVQFDDVGGAWELEGLYFCYGFRSNSFGDVYMWKKIG